MSNNKQSSVEWFAERTFNLIELMKSRYVNQEEFLDGMLKLRDQAKEMENKQRIKDKLELSASLVKNKEQQHETTWVAALDYGIEKMKGLNNLESKDAFDNYYNETFGGNNE